MIHSRRTVFELDRSERHRGPSPNICQTSIKQSLLQICFNQLRHVTASPEKHHEVCSQKFVDHSH